MNQRLVSRAELEALLSEITGRTADPRAGIFGPASITWKINREAALFLGAGRAALLQLAHPWVATALEQHSSLLNDPIARFHNTFRIVFTMIFGSLGQALAAARYLHTLHTRIGGELKEEAGRWAKGARYEANEVAALRWVFATLVESAVLAYRFVLPLEDAECEQYYQESKTMAALFGIPTEELPGDWVAFSHYCEEMVDSGALAVTPRAGEMGQALLNGAGSRVHPPNWYRAVTTLWIPAPLRQGFGLEVSAKAAHAARRAEYWLPRLWPMLPPIVRFVGPYREAQERRSNHFPGPFLRASNRFWIGQSRLGFTEEP